MKRVCYRPGDRRGLGPCARTSEHSGAGSRPTVGEPVAAGDAVLLQWTTWGGASGWDRPPLKDKGVATCGGFQDWGGGRWQCEGLETSWRRAARMRGATR